MKQAFFHLLAALLLTASTHAAVVISATSLGGSVYATSTGGFLSDGFAVRIGRFDTSGGNRALLETSNDFSVLNALFRPLGEGQANGGNVSQSGGLNLTSSLVMNPTFTSGAFFAPPGHLTGSIEDISATYLANGTPLFAWVFNHSDPTQATEWGIFTSSMWTFPNDLSGLVMNTQNINDIVRGQNVGGTTAGQFRLASINAVPEPAGALLLLCAGLMLHLRRRQHA